MKEVLVLLAIGLAVGLPAAIGLGRFVASQLYGIEPHDPWMAAGTMALLALVSAAAGLIPGAPRQPHRSDPGAQIRVRDYTEGWIRRLRRLHGYRARIQSTNP